MIPRVVKVWIPFLAIKAYNSIVDAIEMCLINQIVDMMRYVFTTNYYNITVPE